jgi:hypothetical protein
MNTLKNQVAALIEGGKYEKASNLVAKKLGIKMSILSIGYDKHFHNDIQERYIFKLKLSKGGKQYTFRFGQSIAKGGEEPTLYDVLACLQKYDVGTFEDFCNMFGYDEDSRSAERIYKAVCREYAAMQRLFTDEELEILAEIN